MSRDTSLQLRANVTEAEDREQASGAATRFVRTHYADPEAWVRLAFSVVDGARNTRLFHFDAFGPTLSEQQRVIVSYASTEVWKAVLADELDSCAAR